MQYTIIEEATNVFCNTVIEAPDTMSKKEAIEAYIKGDSNIKVLDKSLDLGIAEFKPVCYTESYPSFCLTEKISS
jgi:hypothetical protein